MVMELPWMVTSCQLDNFGIDPKCYTGDDIDGYVTSGQCLMKVKSQGGCHSLPMTKVADVFISLKHVFEELEGFNLTFTLGNSHTCNDDHNHNNHTCNKK